LYCLYHYGVTLMLDLVLLIVIVLGTVLMNAIACVVVYAILKESDDKYLTIKGALLRTFLLLFVICLAAGISFFNLTHLPDVTLSSYNHTIIT
jgi:hypothetical protein